MRSRGSRWTPAGALRRAVEVLRQEGLRSLWFKAVGELGYRRLLLLEAATSTAIEPQPRSEPLEFGFLTLPELEELSFPEADREVAAERIARGDRCFGVRRDGTVVAVRWVAGEEALVDYLGCRLRLAAGVVYVYDAYTAAEARGAGIFATTWHVLAERLAGEGIHTILGSVLPENRPARRALAKLPYRTVGTFGHVRVGPWKRCFLRARTGAATVSRP